MTERGIIALRGVLSSAVAVKVITAGEAEQFLQRLLDRPVTRRRLVAALLDLQRAVPLLGADDLNAAVRQAIKDVQEEGDRGA